MSSFINEYAISKFGKRTVNKLAKKGIFIIGTQSIPAKDGSWANAELCYVINDNGTAKVKSDMEILNLAK